jgi:phage baseplate assembly protein gpV
MLIIYDNKNSHLINKEDLAVVEVGNTVYDPAAGKFYIVLASGELTEINSSAIPVETLEALTEAVAAGGEIRIKANIDAPTAFVIAADTVITNNAEITIKEDTVGDGVFKAIEGTLTLNGGGVINGLGNNAYSMAIWATENGKVVINDGYFTNVGAYSENDGEHFDLIYASGNGQIEINGGEFVCETPRWTLNIKDKDRTTASIIVKGGRFHGFDPSNCNVEGEGTNFVAPGYKVIEEDGVFVVMPE